MAEANILQPIEPQIDESIEALIERTVQVLLEQDFEAARTEAEPKDIIEEKNDEEIRCEAEEDVQAKKSRSISVEPMVEDQNSGAKSLEIPNETPSEQPEADDSSDIPYSNMSYEEFGRCQRAKTKDLEKFFRDLNKASTQQPSFSAPPSESSNAKEASFSETPMPD